MKLFSKKPAEAKSGASGAASTEPLSAERADEILREYSPEDNERQLTKWVARVVNVCSPFISCKLESNFWGFYIESIRYGNLFARSVIPFFNGFIANFYGKDFYFILWKKSFK